MEKRHALSEYIALLKERSLFVRAESADPGRTVENLTFDDRESIPGTLFICKGARFKEEYLKNAYAKGAFAYVSERSYGVPGGVIVADVRKAMAYLAVLFTDNAAQKMRLVGITGTKGKSTTAFFVKSVLDNATGGKCGIVSTIRNYDGAGSAEAALSTPESVQLNKYYASAYENGMEFFVTELSSQALKYDRALGIEFEVGCFTNLGRDHISPVEHADEEDYFRSKLKIFDSCRTACVNSACARFEEIFAAAKEKCEKVYTFGRRETDDIRCVRELSCADGISFEFCTPFFQGAAVVHMHGGFNADNALAAIACCTALGIDGKYIVKGLKSVRVEGRMEHYSSADGNVNVIVDYAHNGMSLEALLGSVKDEFPESRVITVFGCPGGKAPERRSEMGGISARFSSLTVITEDDEGEEPLEDICAEIARAVSGAGGEYIIIPDRERAINKAITECEGKSVVVLAGKGCETHQRRKDGPVKVPSDAEYAVKYLKEYDLSHNTAAV